MEYKITKAFGIRFDIIYSAAHRTNAWPGKAPPLGLEFNLKVHYKSEDKFHAVLGYALLFPLAGLDPIPETAQNEASAVHALETRLIIQY